jgi:hypothetical protein
MPVEDCNDDYYHGILRSREGVYESYLIIAKVAAEKENKEIERKFLEYAEEYRMANQKEFPSPVSKLAEKEPVQIEQKGEERKENVMIERKVEKIKETPEIQKVVEPKKTVEIKEIPKAITPEKPAEILEISKVIEPEKRIEIKEIPKAIEVPKQEKEVPAPNAEIIAKKYNQFLLDGMALALDGNFKKAYEILKEALELENCNCFPKDERVQILYNALNKAYSK